jgi:predicted CxxxxCH...CXXCH cytochrome family protein
LRHVDGVVDTVLPDVCSGCHGSSDNLAPPTDTLGNRSASIGGVGAHQAHVLGTDRSRAVPCAECHLVPEAVTSEGHLDTPLPAELNFSGVAAAHETLPNYSNGSCQASYCHGADFPGRHESGGSLTAPAWTVVDGSQVVCGSCHGLPPPPPHPDFAECADCHRNMFDDHRTFRDPELHVNGIAEMLVE